MREGLVKYFGKRRGKFGQRVGSYPIRMWCTLQPHHERWLSEAEATLWQRAGQWRVIRWREGVEQITPTTVVTASPSPPAVHVATALEQAEQEVAKAEEKRPLVDATFTMATSGIVHATGCPNGPGRPYKTFNALERAMADEDFSKVHQSCCRDHLKALNEASLESIYERRTGAIAQMNAAGESYGLDQDEA